VTVLSPETREEQLRQLELLVTRRLDGLIHGDHQGLVPAAGSEPGDARAYRIGDDVRHIDWNLTARTTVPHVRDTTAERELEAWLVIDRSASMDFGTARSEKRDLAHAAAAAFTFMNGRAGNRVGAVIAGASGLGLVPARTGRAASLAVVHGLAVDVTRAEPGAAVPTLADALVAADRLALRRGMVVVISDFLDGSPWARRVDALARRHHVIGVEVRDPREDDLPPVGLLTLVDPETGRRLEVNTNSPKLRARFAKAAAERRSDTGTALRRAGARHLVLSTDRDWLLDIVRAVVAWRRRQ
jgi:uncharacterized protein (DUF58 family)